MTTATREALERVAQILHDAGWDQAPGSADTAPGAADLGRIRRAYDVLLRHDYFDILRAVLEEGLTVEQAGARRGLAPEEASRVFVEALRRLSDFVDSYAGSGTGSAA